MEIETGGKNITNLQFRGGKKATYGDEKPQNIMSDIVFWPEIAHIQHLQN